MSTLDVLQPQLSRKLSVPPQTDMSACMGHVWDMFVEPNFRNVLERTVFDYLRRFVYSLECYWKSPMWIAVNFCDI